LKRPTSTAGKHYTNGLDGRNQGRDRLIKVIDKEKHVRKTKSSMVGEEKDSVDIRVSFKKETPGKNKTRDWLSVPSVRGWSNSF